MGLLSSLFGHSDILPDLPAEKEAPSPSPELYQDMTLSVVLEDGSTLLSGRLTAFDRDSLTIERLPGWLAFDTCPVHRPVTVRGYAKNMSPILLSGSIQESSRIICRVQDLKVETIEEHRNTFRLPVSSPASLHYPSDEHLKNPEACTLVDISTGGACIESEFLHAEGEVLKLKVKIEEYAPLSYLGQIIRVTECEGGERFRYGFLFAQLTEDEITELTRLLYNIQLGNRREWVRSPSGAWH